MVTVRFFAAARAAVGDSVREVPPATLAGILADFDAPVLAKCSYLVNGVAESDGTRALVDGDTVDVMPPFAGG